LQRRRSSASTRILTDLHRQKVPVPKLRAAATVDGILGMILEDLGDPVRDATEQDAALAAVRLYAAEAPA
jgi:tRNA A-37 threonylcarbamoyl transferase component Bud32